MLYSLIVINWQSVIVNSFWILGLAILLAAFSYHYWLANEESRRLRDQLNQPTFQRLYWLSFVFVGIGLAGTSQKTWEMIVWIIFTLFSVVNTVGAYRSSKVK
ncbi:MAG: hypothetical protein P8183_11850 [Anaerolineae bacterium]